MAEENRRCPNRTPGNRDAAVPPVDYFYMPAMPPLWLGAAVKRLFRAWRRRRNLRELSRLDDRLLRDIGVKRDDVG